MIGDGNRKTVLCGMDTSSYDDVERIDETTMTMSPIGTKILLIRWNCHEDFSCILSWDKKNDSYSAF